MSVCDAIAEIEESRVEDIIRGAITALGQVVDDSGYTNV